MTIKDEWLIRAKLHFEHLKELLAKIATKRFVGEAILKEFANLSIFLPECEMEDMTGHGNLTKKEICKVKLQLLTNKIYEIAKEMNIMSRGDRKKMKKFQKHSYSPVKTIGFHSRGYTAPKNDKTKGENRMSTESFKTPDIRDKWKPKDEYISVHKGELSFNIKPEIIMTKKAHDKIKVWCNLLDDEIQALGIVKRSSCFFYIEDFFLFHQIVSGAACEERDAGAICELMDEIEKAGYSSSDLKAWWHSHNTMGVTPSARDLETTEKYGAKGYLISLITNHRGEFNSKITFNEPFPFEVKDVPVYIQDEKITDEFVEERKKEIEKYVKKREYVTHVYRSGHETYPYGFHGEFGYMAPPLITDVPKKDEPAPTELNTQEDDPNMFITDEQMLERIKKGEAPYETNFSENSVHYVWWPERKKYHCYDHLGNALSSEDLKELGACDYNKEIEELLAKASIQEKSSPTTVEGA